MRINAPSINTAWLAGLVAAGASQGVIGCVRASFVAACGADDHVHFDVSSIMDASATAAGPISDGLQGLILLLDQTVPVHRFSPQFGATGKWCLMRSQFEARMYIIWPTRDISTVSGPNLARTSFGMRGSASASSSGTTSTLVPNIVLSWLINRRVNEHSRCHRPRSCRRASCVEGLPRTPGSTVRLVPSGGRCAGRPRKALPPRPGKGRDGQWRLGIVWRSCRLGRRHVANFLPSVVDGIVDLLDVIARVRHLAEEVIDRDLAAQQHVEHVFPRLVLDVRREAEQIGAKPRFRLAIIPANQRAPGNIAGRLNLDNRSDVALAVRSHHAVASLEVAPDLKSHFGLHSRAGLPLLICPL